MAWDSGRYIGKNTADNQVDTSAVTSDANGSVLERLEWVQSAVGGSLGQVSIQQSIIGPVEENAYVQFNIALFDIYTGAIALADIDITGITNVLEKSTGGAAFSSAGITQPVFAKAAGSVYDAYQFAAAEWQAGDMFKLTVSGITVDIGSTTYYIPDLVWVNVITELETLEDLVTTVDSVVDLIPSSTGSLSWNATALAAIEGECTDAIEADSLDKLISASDGGVNAYPDSVAQDSILAYVMGKGNPALVTSYDNTTDSLEALRDRIDAYTEGKCRIFEKSITSAANAGDVTVATITTQACLIESIVLHADTASQTDLTTAAITGGASKVVSFLSTAATAVANLDDADDQVAWTGAVRLAATKTIVISLVGTGATAVDFTVSIKYRSCADGGYLA